MFRQVLLVTAIGLASAGPVLAEPASPDEVMAAIRTFYPGVTLPGPVPLNADLAGGIARGLDGDWYRADLLGPADPERVKTACSRIPYHMATAPNEITVVQESKPAPVTFRYTYAGGSLYSEWVDTPALFARLGLEQMPNEGKRRQTELNVLRNNSGFVVIVRPSENILWMYSLAGGPRLYARCGLPTSGDLGDLHPAAFVDGSMRSVDDAVDLAAETEVGEGLLPRRDRDDEVVRLDDLVVGADAGDWG